MKAVKIVLGVVALVVVLLAVAAAIIASRFDPNSYKAEIAALVKDKTGRTLTLDGPLALSIFPRLEVKAEKLALSDAPGRDGKVGNFARIGSLRLSLALLPLLSQQVVVDRVTLTGVSALVVKHKDGKTSIDDLTGGGSRKDNDKDERARPASVALDVAGVDVAVDSLVWRDERDGGEWRITGLKLETGRIADDAAGKLKLAARIEGTNPSIRADLDLSSAYKLNISTQMISLSDLSLKIGGDLPSLKGAKLAVTGHVEADWQKPAAGGDIIVKFDESTLKTKFDLKGGAEKGGPMAITFDADLDKLSVDRYQATADGGKDAGKSGAGGGAAKPAPAGAEQPLDLEALKTVNLKGQLRVGELRYNKLKAEKIQLGVNAAGGRVNMDPINASLYGGTLAGTVSVNANTYQFAAKQRLNGIQIGPLLRDGVDKDLLEGRGTVGLDVQTAGRTVSALKKALDGTASLQLADGAVKGINLAESLRKAKTVLGSKSAQEQASTKGDKTDFSELTASFAIKNGVAHNEDLSMKSPFLRLGGAGDLDVGENRMNYLAKAAVVNTSAGQGGKDLESLAGLTVPVRISGPFEALSYRIEFGSMVSDSVKQKVQESVKDKVQNTLKGLFKR